MKPTGASTHLQVNFFAVCFAFRDKLHHGVLVQWHGGKPSQGSHVHLRSQDLAFADQLFKMLEITHKEPWSDGIQEHALLFEWIAELVRDSWRDLVRTKKTSQPDLERQEALGYTMIISPAFASIGSAPGV